MVPQTKWQPRGSHGPSTGKNYSSTQHDGRHFKSDKPINFNRRYQPKCQICDQFGHIAKHCPQFHPQNVSINCSMTSAGKNNTWLLDSAASHNITGDLSNLSVHSEYDGIDELLLGDGTGLTFSYIGSLNLKSPCRNFTLYEFLYVPNLHKNLIYVHHFTKQNNVFCWTSFFSLFCEGREHGGDITKRSM